MGTIAVGFVIAIVGMVVLIVTEGSFILYAVGWATGVLGLLILFGVALRDRLRARKTEHLDDVGFN